MERKEFLKKLGLGGILLPLAAACTLKSDPTPVISTTSCAVTPTEEEGPFPYTSDGTTKSEISNPLNRGDVRTNSADGVVQTGVELTITITVVNTNSSCSVVQGVRIDLWHCNRNGWYSGYAGQSGGVDGTPSSYLGENWLRGYQTTDVNGVVKFTTIFPGWYSGRATHIHFEAFLNTVLKKQTQLTFPETVSDVVHVSSLYSAHGVNPTRNAGDSVFGDSAADLANETFNITGNVSDGYVANYELGIAL